jgi:hypothetical protein
VDGEIGRFSFETYHKENAYGEVLYNTSREFFFPLQGEEKYCTEGFKEIALIYGATEESYRKTSALLNRIRHQEEVGTPFRTVREAVEHEGTLLHEYLEKKTSAIFKENGFTPEGYPHASKPKLLTHSTSILEEEDIEELLDHSRYVKDYKSEILSNPVPYEKTKTSVNISIDDVGAKKQKEHRDGKPTDSPSKKKRVYVQNTVVHVEKGGESYILNGYGVLFVLRILLGFLLHNDLLSHRLIFFVDGNYLYRKVLGLFSWHKGLSLILDWYHLKKKCKSLLSMAMKGTEIRKKILENLTPLLWHGLVDQAVIYLESLPESEIKNEEARLNLITYLTKNRPMIPVYAVRKRLGLRNSSNRGEKANDLMVANRQKHKGMSWSTSGSVSLASVTALKQNQEYKQWFREREIEFKLVS